MSFDEDDIDNLTEELLEDIKLQEGDPSDFPSWYQQFLELPENVRLKIREVSIERLKEAKPEAYKFIQKFKCELVGITPQIMYALLKKSEGDIDTTWVHGYSMPTLLFWCKQGGFGFFVNAVLDYNDTVLNKVEGNKVDRKIRGFTG